MITKIFGFILSLSFALSACSTKKSEDSSSQPVGEQKVFTGPWETGNLSFTSGQCAFRLDLINETEFIINEFTASCSNDGEHGLYAPLHFVKADASQFTPAQLSGFTPPAGAKVLAIQKSSGPEPRGWIDEAQKKFYFAVGLTDNELFNRLSLAGQIEDENHLSLTKIEMREGFRVADKIVFTPQYDDSSSVIGAKTPWSQLKLPNYAAPSVGTKDRNYLYCVQATNPSSLTLVDFVTKKYEIDSTHTIGEIGSINLNGENQVYMARTDAGSFSQQDGYDTYFLSVTLVGGRTTSGTISIQPNGYAILTWNYYTRSLCRFLQNDIFKGRYAGWNP